MAVRLSLFEYFDEKESEAMGKFYKKKPRNRLKGILILVLSLLLVLLIWFAMQLEELRIPIISQHEESIPAETAVAETEGEETQVPETEVAATEPTYIDLPNGLRIEMIGGYTGIYMEDGSDELVSGVMMILLSNQAENDLQIARIYLTYSDFTAEFEVTNLPAGERVVVLEKNRQSETLEKYQSVESRNVVFFPETMNLAEDRISIAGRNGMLEITNITEEDIPGPVFIYYKTSAVDLLYGGITYRVTISEGLKAGETRNVIAGHFTLQNSRLLMVGCGA
jgi:hypothetical protein